MVGTWFEGDGNLAEGWFGSGGRDPWSVGSRFEVRWRVVGIWWEDDGHLVEGWWAPDARMMGTWWKGGWHLAGGRVLLTSHIKSFFLEKAYFWESSAK